MDHRGRRKHISGVKVGKYLLGRAVGEGISSEVRHVTLRHVIHQGYQVETGETPRVPRPGEGRESNKGKRRERGVAPESCVCQSLVLLRV